MPNAPTSENRRELLSLEATARELGVSIKTVRVAVDVGQLKTVRFGKRRWVRAVDLALLIRDRSAVKGDS